MDISTVVVSIYLLLVVSIGFYFRNKSKDMEDFFVGGRSFDLWFNVNTMSATAIGAGTTMGIAGMAYSSGITAGWILVGYSIGFGLIGILIAKKMHKLNAVTMPDIIKSRFNETSRGLSTVLVTIQYIGIGAAQVLALGVLAQNLLGISFQNSILLTGSVMIIYTALGGLFAVAVTDVIQMIINAIGLTIIIPFIGLRAVDGLSGLTSSLPASFFNPMAMGIAGVVSSLAWIIPQGFLSQELWIRVFASKNEKVAKNATLISSFGIYLPYMVSVVVIGITGAALFPEISGDAVIPHMISQLTPPLLKGILFAALIATVMSCADSVLLVASSNLVRDVYLRYFVKKDLSYKKTVLISRIAVLILGILCIILALNAQTIIDVMQNMATPFVGAIFPIVLALFFWKKATSKGVIATMIVSIVTSIILFTTNVNTTGLHNIVINLIICVITLVIVSLITYSGTPEKFENVDQNIIK